MSVLVHQSMKSTISALAQLAIGQVSRTETCVKLEQAHGGCLQTGLLERMMLAGTDYDHCYVLWTVDCTLDG